MLEIDGAAADRMVVAAAAVPFISCFVRGRIRSASARVWRASVSMYDYHLATSIKTLRSV